MLFTFLFPPPKRVDGESAGERRRLFVVGSPEKQLSTAKRAVFSFQILQQCGHMGPL